MWTRPQYCEGHGKMWLTSSFRYTRRHGNASPLVSATRNMNILWVLSWNMKAIIVQTWKLVNVVFFFCRCSRNDNKDTSINLSSLGESAESSSEITNEFISWKRFSNLFISVLWPYVLCNDRIVTTLKLGGGEKKAKLILDLASVWDIQQYI